MSEVKNIPERIFITKDSLCYPLFQRIMKNTRAIPHEVIDSPSMLMEELKRVKDPFVKGKSFLLLSTQRGGFVKPCPCTPFYIGCNYFIINSELNCPLDCSYCVLQDYLSTPLVTVHVNLEDLWKEMDAFLEKRKGRVFRIGTGELADSLALDPITESSRDFISYFRGKKGVFFELKTKTTNIKHILDEKPADNIIVSWSLNTPEMAEEHESKAPPIAERIEAARQVSRRGFPVGFHFDPLIRYPGWQMDYQGVIKNLLRAVRPSGIAWISLGSLRFPPGFQSIIKQRFPLSPIFHEEFIRGKDGKFRYFRPLRIELYRRVVDFINENGGKGIPLYLCMESGSVWREILGWRPRSEREVESSLLPRGNITLMR